MSDVIASGPSMSGLSWSRARSWLPGSGRSWAGTLTLGLALSLTIASGSSAAASQPVPLWYLGEALEKRGFDVHIIEPALWLEVSPATTIADLERLAALLPRGFEVDVTHRGRTDPASGFFRGRLQRIASQPQLTRQRQVGRAKVGLTRNYEYTVAGRAPGERAGGSLLPGHATPFSRIVIRPLTSAEPGAADEPSLPARSAPSAQARSDASGASGAGVASPSSTEPIPFPPPLPSHSAAPALRPPPWPGGPTMPSATAIAALPASLAPSPASESRAGPLLPDRAAPRATDLPPAPEPARAVAPSMWAPQPIRAENARGSESGAPLALSATLAGMGGIGVGGLLAGGLAFRRFVHPVADQGGVRTLKSAVAELTRERRGEPDSGHIRRLQLAVAAIPERPRQRRATCERFVLHQALDLMAYLEARGRAAGLARLERALISRT